MTDDLTIATPDHAPVRSSDLDRAKGERLVAAFLAGRSERTHRAYERDLRHFATFVGAESSIEAASYLIAQSHGDANALVLHYRAHMREAGLAAATVNRRLAALRSMVKLARTIGQVPWSLDVEGVKAEPYRDTRGPGRSGYVVMLAELERQGEGLKMFRDRAMLRLLYDLALRRAEVVALDLEDVDLDADAIAVKGKGRESKERRTLPPPTAEAVREWIDARGQEPGPLFISLDPAGKGDGRLTGTSLYRIVRKLGRKAGIGSVRPHGLRHAAITEALDLTKGDVRAVQRFSRHRDLRTLNIYDDNREDLAGDVARLVARAAG